ncbi:gliding motility-associated C-terminal domain-containing protein [Thalassobellus suaedae]|uniref:Gliding motility-associated C-terminal domain-containing protein n=1 Tax=Thalassobellus suaedae TaxID=3074124 RepID=A0ABY9XXB2_9FLAO|nr:gliding motility-associated C-terminal domain-containing protein [Flavobacteriaceae bacterium HL-DH14]
MKTITLKNNLIKILTCLLILVGSNIYGQTTPIINGTIGKVETYCTVDPNKCTSQNVQIDGVYIGDENGVPLTSANVGDYDATDNFYLFATVNLSVLGKNNFYVKFNLIKYLEDGTKTTTPVAAFLYGTLQAGIYKVDFPIEEYVVGGEINSLYGFEDVYLAWNLTAISGTNFQCPSDSTPQCNGSVPDQIAVGPFLVVPSFDSISCNGGTTDVTLITGGGVSPYEYTYLNNDTNATATNTTGIFNNLPAGNYTFTSEDSDNNVVVQNITISEPTQLVNSVNSPALSCSTGTTSATFTASGGTAPYTFVINGNNTGASPTWNSPNLVFNGASEGSIILTFFDANGCEATNNITITAGDTQDPVITAPTPLSIQGCDVSAITEGNSRYTYSSTKSEDKKGSYETNDLPINYTASDDGTIASITYTDVITNASCPIIVTRTFTITDDCGKTATAVQTININTPVINVTAPSAVNLVACTSEADILTAYNTWKNGFTVSGGCSPTDNMASFPELTDLTCGGSLGFTLSATSLGCSSSESAVSSFTVETAPDLVATAPAAVNLPACSTTTDIQTAYNAWKLGFTISGGCSPTDNMANFPALTDLTCGGSLNFTLSANNVAGGCVDSASSAASSFTVQTAPDLVATAPAAVNLPACSTTADIQTAYDAWKLGFTVSGGCSPTDNMANFPALTDLTCGGSLNFTLSANNVAGGCVDSASSAASSFTVQTAPDLVATAPAAVNLPACSTTADIQTAYDAWKLGFTVSGGCSPTDNMANFPALTDLTCGGSLNFTLSANNVAGGCVDSASSAASSFTVETAPDLVATAPAAVNLPACSTTADIQTAYDAWKLGFTVSGGCSPTDNMANFPALTDLTCGGSLNFTLSANNVAGGCVDSASSAASSFTVETAPDLVATAPAAVNLPACSTTADIQTAYDAWKLGFTVSGGCSPTDNMANFPALTDLTCGGSLNFTLSANNVAGGCVDSASSAASSFTVQTAPDLVATAPAAVNLPACSTTADIQTAYDAWKLGFTVSGGCSPTDNMANFPALTDLTCGGSLNFTLSANNVAGGCVDSASSAASSFTVETAPDLVATAPAAVNLPACSTTADIQTAYDAWKLGFTVSGGCSPTDNMANFPALTNLTCGGSLNFTLSANNVAGGCVDSASSAASSFTVQTPNAIVYTNPSDANLQSCDFVDQGEIDTAFTNWVNAQSTAIAEADGCSPVLTNNSASATIPDKCSGGTATVTWTITDLCETINTITADFNLTKQQDIGHEEPDSKTVEACSFNSSNLVDAQAALDADIAAWVAKEQFDTRIIEGGCSPTITTNYGSQSIDFCTGGKVTITFTVNDDCQGHSHDATYTLIQPDAVAYTNPSDDTSVASEFNDSDPTVAQTNLDNDIIAWVTAQTDIINNSLTGGCSPNVSNDFVDQSIAFCASGSITITWTIEDICGTTNPTATYTFTQPDVVEYTAPSGDTAQACEFDNEDAAAAQTALDADIAAWVSAQTDIINNSLTGGGSPTVSNDYIAQSIDFCTGGDVTITWTVADICATTNPTATYTLTQPDAVDYTAPSGDTAQSCEFDNEDATVTQTALDADIAAWVTAQTDIINNSLTGGCSPIVSNDFVAQSIDFCKGGDITITWTVADICGTTNPTATYTLTQPDAVTYTAPSGDTAQSCEFDNDDATAAQTALDADIAAWVTAQTDIINNSLTGGCSPIVSNDFVAQSIDFCKGGDITITWTVADICGTTNPTATYTLTQPDAVTYTAPSGDTAQSCEFDNDDATAAQTALDADIAAWVTAQTDIINNSLTGGCSPTVSNDFVAQSIDFCKGGDITITWTVADICGTTNPTATYTLTQPDAVTYTAPSGDTAQSCEFDNDDATAAQTALDADIAAWVTAQTDIINNSLTGGCSPTVSNDFVAQSIDFCTGGTVMITWTVADICGTTNPTATYTLTQPDAVTYTAPNGDNAQACEFDNDDASTAQTALDADIAAWVTAQTDIITNSLTGGCSPTVSNDFVAQSIDFCTGGTVMITWTVTDICGTTNPTATYTLTQPDAVTYTNPSDDASVASEFNDSDAAVAQSNLDADIAAWVTAQTDIINNSLTGGCSPTVSNDYIAQSIDFCTGGDVTITWTIEDICGTTNPTATYTFTQPDIVAYTAPSGDTAQACEFDNDDAIAAQTALDADIAAWVTAQTDIINNSLTGGESPTVSNDFVAQSIDFCTGGTVTITWTVADICATTNPTATYTLTQPDAVTYTAPSGDTAQACEFDNADAAAAQTALDADIAAWVSAQTDIINNSLTGGCSPTVSNDFVAQSIDFCTGGTVMITWTVTDICGTTNPTATYTLTQPDALAYTAPSGDTAQACEFDNDDAAAAQTALDADIAAWVSAQTDIINNSLTGGCSPTVSNDFVAQSIDFCTGGTVMITWTVADICGTTNPTATYTLTQPDAVAYTTPSGDTAQSCEFDNTNAAAAQTALDADIAAWVTAQTDIINNSLTGGCSPTVSNDFVAQSIDFCTGGDVTITWTVADICGTTNPTATYTLTQPNAVTYTAPSGDTAQSCEFDNDDAAAAQTALDADIAAWVTAQTDIITNSLIGGCSPTVSNDFVAQSIDFCTGGDVTITWTVTDICGTTNPMATYTYTAATPVIFDQQNLPEDMTVECDNVPNAIILTASTNCGAIVVNYNESKLIDGNCPSSYKLKRTWTATDHCSTTISHTQTITVQDTKAPTASSFDTILDVSCTNIPEVPSIEFTDNCSTNLKVEFEETNSYDENVLTDYQIVRTWTVTDECDNTADFTQTINVSLDEVVTQITSQPRCYDDGIVDLNSFLSNTNLNGTWEIVEGDLIATLSGSLFNPTTLEISDDFLPEDGGIDYLFKYTTSENGCINVIELTMNINADCVVLPCGENDIEISKAVTPNGDSYNETFDIMGIDLCGFVAEVKIFNRWGALVYESNNYTLGSIDTSGTNGDWNGSAPKGSLGNAEKVPNGTYYYIIVLKNSGLKPFTIFNLLRNQIKYLTYETFKKLHNRYFVV